MHIFFTPFFLAQLETFVFEEKKKNKKKLYKIPLRKVFTRDLFIIGIKKEKFKQKEKFHFKIVLFFEKKINSC